MNTTCRPFCFLYCISTGLTEYFYSRPLWNNLNSSLHSIISLLRLFSTTTQMLLLANNTMPQQLLAFVAWYFSYILIFYFLNKRLPFYYSPRFGDFLKWFDLFPCLSFARTVDTFYKIEIQGFVPITFVYSFQIICV